MILVVLVSVLVIFGVISVLLSGLRFVMMIELFMGGGFDYV